MRLHNAYKLSFWEHIIDHISKTGNVSSLKFSGKQDLTMHFCISLIKCSFMTQFFCSIDIAWKNLNQHKYGVLADWVKNKLLTLCLLVLCANSL